MFQYQPRIWVEGGEASKSKALNIPVIFISSNPLDKIW